MKEKTIFISSVIIAFIFGVLSTYLLMTKQQMDNIMQLKQQAPLARDNENTVDQTNNPLAVLEDLNNRADAKILSTTSNANSSSASINDYSEQQALEIVNQMPDYMLGQYVDKFMAKGASEVISDKRRFAQRAVEELYKENDNQPLSGTIKLSLDSSLPSISVDTSNLNKDAKLFAHLDTDGKVPVSAFVFVKWVNNQTGQVLLFEKKDIVANSNQNWVSFKPYDGWTQGSYDIRFYQFTSELEPIAQLTYQIFEVDESQNGMSANADSVVTATISK